MSKPNGAMADRIKQNWIRELEDWGVKRGPNGEPLQTLQYGEIRRMILREQLKRDLG